MSDQVSMTKHCSNCKKDVAEANFVMHEIHCRRNIILCSKCNEPVPKAQLEEHIEQNHALVNCDLCSQLVERRHLDRHKTDLCSKRDKVCTYCSLSVKADELEDHESYCGTRTEQCVKCHSYIMLKDQSIHDESECNLPEHVESTSKADFFSHYSSGAWNDFSARFERENDDSGEQYKRRSQRESVDPFADSYLNLHKIRHKNSNSAGDSYFSKRDVAPGRLETDRWYGSRVDEPSDDDKLFDDFLRFTSQRNLGISKEDNEIKETHLDSEQDVAFLPCEFCDESFPYDVIIQHQALCGSQFEDTSYGSIPDYGTNLFENAVKTDPDKGIITASLTREMTMLPCEFCSESYPNNELMTHQLSCELGHFRNQGAASDHFENANQLASLPSGLNKYGANKISSSSSLRTSTSVPAELSHLESSSVTVTTGRTRPGASINHSKNFVSSKKPISRQLHGERQMNRGSADFPSHQLKESSDARPLRGMQNKDSYESSVSHLQAEAAGSNSLRNSFAVSKPNSTVNQSVTSRQNTKDSRRKPLGSPQGAMPFQQASSHSRSMVTRLATDGQSEKQHNRTGHEEQEKEIGAGRTRTKMTGSNYPRKNSRSSQDLHGNH